MINPIPDYNASYIAAINSPKWIHETTEIVRKRDGNKCRVCGCEKGLQVHHIRYQNDRGENDFFNTKWLVTLCGTCHKVITEAVEKAKGTRIEVPAFMVKPGQYAPQQIEYKIKHAAYVAEAELVAETLFELWKKSIGRKPINMRSLNILKPIGEIVVNSIEYQAGMTAMGYGVAFAERTIAKITQYLAEAYNHYMGEGLTDQWFQNEHGLNSAQMTKVRRNAERLIKNGTISGAPYFADGAGAGG